MGRVEIGSLKTHESRSVAIPRFVCNLLEPIVSGRGPEEFVWPGADGGALRLPGHGSFFHGALERVRAEDSSFPVVTVHGMRHVAAGLLVSSGGVGEGCAASVGACVGGDDVGYLR